MSGSNNPQDLIWIDKYLEWRLLNNGKDNKVCEQVCSMK